MPHAAQVKLRNYDGIDEGIREKQLVVIANPHGRHDMALSLGCLAPVSSSVDDGINIDLIDKFCT